VQAVAWIPGRNDSLLAVFALASFLAFLRYLDTRKPDAYVARLIFFALGLFTKETAIMVAAVSFLYVALIDKKALSGRETRFFVWGWFITIVCWFIIRDAALRGTFESTAGSLAAAFFVSAPAFVQYIGKILMPFNLSVFPIIKDTTFLYGIAAIILLFFALRYSKAKRWPFVIFGLFWFFLFLAPSFLRPSAKFVHDFQEHRMYLPLVGMIIAVGEIDIFKRMMPSAKTLAACVLTISIFAAINVRHGENFRNRVTYWENAAATSPSSWLTHLKVASIYYDEGSLDKAEQEYLKVVSLDRVSSPAYAGLGHVYMTNNMPDKAEAQFKKAVAAYPANYPVYVSLGTLYYRQGKLEAAAAMWAKALRYEPTDMNALKNLAIFYAEQKDYKAARFYVERLLETGVGVPPDFIEKIKGD
jgi:Tfp pilus assembly protein PilF